MSPRRGAEPTRLREYEQRSALPMVAAGVGFLVVYTVQVLAVGLPAWADRGLAVVNVSVWVVFGLDLVVRVVLSGRPVRYLAAHPVDVAAVLLPVLRPLKLLRVFTVGQNLFRGAGSAGLLQTTQAVVCAVGLLLLMGALAVLDAERGVPGATITGFADALWWAGATVTTVGYGDVYPVTGIGRVVAGALMVIGIALVGVVTATMAGWIVGQGDADDARERDELPARLDTLQAETGGLRGRLDTGDDG